MTLEILQKEMISAMKGSNKPRKEVISTLIGDIKKAAIDRKCKDNITEKLVNEILLKSKKTVQEMIDTCPKERTELLEKYNFDMSVIDEFAPKLITDKKIIQLMIHAIVGKNYLVKENRGYIMKELKGKVDMTIANEVIKEIINKY